ncbi:MAG: cell division protein SepF [Clostridiales bacterium]|nr:cell division protein SepF [Clostridiales bacterium]
MGIFDFFDRSDSVKKNQKVDRSINVNFDKETENKGPIVVYHPKGFDEVENIINTLKNKGQALVYLAGLSQDTALRVLDLLSGAVYALDGGVCEVEKNIFLFTPNGIAVK